MVGICIEPGQVKGEGQELCTLTVVKGLGKRISVAKSTAAYLPFAWSRKHLTCPTIYLVGLWCEVSISHDYGDTCVERPSELETATANPTAVADRASSLPDSHL